MRSEDLRHNRLLSGDHGVQDELRLGLVHNVVAIGVIQMELT